LQQSPQELLVRAIFSFLKVQAQIEVLPCLFSESSAQIEVLPCLFSESSEPNVHAAMLP
jgi:hypothetical protein